MSKVIEIENLSKVYDLGLVGTGTLSKDLNRTWAKLTGKPDPYATLVELNDRTKKSSSNMVYALKDINFSVNQGEVLGIIGKNGAGKSTLLKILSQITSPSTGTIKMKGRVASLLEVGTGMHPEMTARQNIYLNGSLMGMRRHEITSKLDEIVDFAGIEKYIDTPTKRFSSGMTVRLGFAIAAFLDPEVLIVDEVLAVGDAEFQKKAIGKMQDISRGEGRTVLFVSHDMNAVNRLCSRVIMLKNGEIHCVGETSEVIKKYLVYDSDEYKTEFKSKNIQDKDICLEYVRIIDERENLINGIYEVHNSFYISLQLKTKVDVKNPLISFHFKNSKDEFVLFSDINDNQNNTLPKEKGLYNYKIKINQPLLKPDRYFLYIGIVNRDTGQANHFGSILNFELKDFNNVRPTRAGYIYKQLEWKS